MAARVHRLLLAAAALLVAVALVLGGPAAARKTGVSGRTQVGCTCHGGGSPDASVAPVLEGVPAQYAPGNLYHLSVKITGGPPYVKGGFDLNASRGVLSVPPGESNVQITTTATFGGTAGEATHKSPDSRAWKIDWKAPPVGSGRVTFAVMTNSVNGNDQPDVLDKWNHVQATSDERNLPPAPLTLTAPAQTGPQRAHLPWTGTPEADVVRIEVHRGTKPGFPITAASKVAEVKDLKATGADVDRLAPNATLYFRIRLVDKGGLMTESNEVSLRLVYVAPKAVAAAKSAAKAPGGGFLADGAAMAAAAAAIRVRPPAPSAFPSSPARRRKP